MKIKPETLKKLRNTKGYSQQALADEAGVDKKTIVRIEGGKGGETRGETAKMIARALGINDFHVLAEDPESETVHSEEFRILGARRVKKEVLLFDETVLAYDLVKEHYGVDMHKLINAAPVLFTLLAEMSLADRRHRLKEMQMAWGAFEEARPDHILHLYPSSAYCEQNSIDKRDIFGREVLNKGELVPELYHEGQNPFSDFLIRQTKELGAQNDAINRGDMMLGSMHPETDGWLWHIPLFRTFRERLTGERRTTGGDYRSRADYALSRGYVRISEIPEHLRGENEEEDEHVVSERVKWLEEQVPDEDWAKNKRLEDGIKEMRLYRRKLAAGSARAYYSLVFQMGALLDKIPEHLRGENEEEDEHVVSERVKWLEEQVPDEAWSEYESWRNRAIESPDNLFNDDGSIYLHFLDTFKYERSFDDSNIESPSEGNTEND